MKLAEAVGRTAECFLKGRRALVLISEVSSAPDRPFFKPVPTNHTVTGDTVDEMHPGWVQWRIRGVSTQIWTVRNPGIAEPFWLELELIGYFHVVKSSPVEQKCY